MCLSTSGVRKQMADLTSERSVTPSQRKYLEQQCRRFPQTWGQRAEDSGALGWKCRAEGKIEAHLTSKSDAAFA